MTRESHGNIEFLNGEVIGFECFFKECFAKYNAFASRFVDDVFVRDNLNRNWDYTLLCIR